MPDESPTTAILDPIRSGIAGGWHVIDATTLTEPVAIEADAVVVGTGAGGGVTAEVLAEAGFNVVLVEEGPLQSSSDFRMREADAYRQLYQESAARKTKDKAISIGCLSPDTALALFSTCNGTHHSGQIYAAPPERFTKVHTMNEHFRPLL